MDLLYFLIRFLGFVSIWNAKDVNRLTIFFVTLRAKTECTTEDTEFHGVILFFRIWISRAWILYSL